MTVTTGPAFVVPVPRPGVERGDVLVRRYLGASLAPGAPAAAGVRTALRGSVRLRGTWCPFRAVQVLTVGHGCTRVVQVAGLGRVVETVVPGAARRHVRIVGRTVREETGSAARHRGLGHLALGLAAAPGAIMSCPGVRWSAVGDTELRITVPVPGVGTKADRVHEGKAHDGKAHEGGADEVAVTYRLDPAGLPSAAHIVAWGVPAGGGRSGWFPYGGPVSAHRTQDGTTVPSAGVLGWFPGSPRWAESVRWQLTAWEALDLGAG